MTAPQRTNPAARLGAFPASIVVVDDDPSIVESLTELLSGEGFLVEAFTDPTSALERLRQGPTPDLVLCDCIMPRLTGAELVDALVAAGVEAPVVMMTALADPSFCVDTGRVSVLNKPFQIDDLLAEIAACLRPASGTRSVRPEAAGTISTRPSS